MLIWQHQPIDQLFKYIPTIIKQSSKITIGNVSFEISEKLSEDINTEMKSALSGLSDEAIIRLIDTGNEIHTIGCMGNTEDESEIETVKELAVRKLAIYSEVTPDKYGNYFKYELTDLGNDANRLVKKALLEQFKK